MTLGMLIWFFSVCPYPIPDTFYQDRVWCQAWEMSKSLEAP